MPGQQSTTLPRVASVLPPWSPFPSSAPSRWSSPSPLRPLPQQALPHPSSGHAHLESLPRTADVPAGTAPNDVQTSPQSGHFPLRLLQPLVGGTDGVGKFLTPSSRPGFHPPAGFPPPISPGCVTVVPPLTHETPQGGPGGFHWNQPPESPPELWHHRGMQPCLPSVVPPTTDLVEEDTMNSPRRYSSMRLVMHRSSLAPMATASLPAAVPFRSSPPATSLPAASPSASASPMTDLAGSHRPPSELASMSSLLNYGNGAVQTEPSDGTDDSPDADLTQSAKNDDSSSSSDEVVSHLSSGSFFVELNSAMEGFGMSDVDYPEGHAAQGDASPANTPFQPCGSDDDRGSLSGCSKEPSEIYYSRKEGDGTDIPSLMLVEFMTPVVGSGTTVSRENPSRALGNAEGVGAVVPEVESVVPKPNPKRLKRSVSFIGLDDKNDHALLPPEPAPTRVLPVAQPPAMHTAVPPQAAAVVQMPPLRLTAAPSMQARPPWMMVPPPQTPTYGSVPVTTIPPLVPRGVASTSSQRP